MIHLKRSAAPILLATPCQSPPPQPSPLEGEGVRCCRFSEFPPPPLRGRVGVGGDWARFIYSAHSNRRTNSSRRYSGPSNDCDTDSKSLRDRPRQERGQLRAAVAPRFPG